MDDECEQQWRELALHADSMLSLLRHRGGGIQWGTTGLPNEWEADLLIGQLRRAYESGSLPAFDS